MKLNTILTLLVALLLLQLNTSCDKNDDIAKPTITIHELGANNSKTVVAGNDLHLDAEIIAPGKIEKITITIHQEGELKSVNGSNISISWEFEQSYTQYTGQKNADFHNHIAVPANSAAGTYHLHITVVDMEGNVVTAEDELEITTPVM